MDVLIIFLIVLTYVTGADNDPLHRIFGPHLFVLLRLYGRKGRSD